MRTAAIGEGFREVGSRPRPFRVSRRAAEVEVRIFGRFVERCGHAGRVRLPYFLVLAVALGEGFRELVG